MAPHSTNAADPRDPYGPFRRLMAEMQHCKAKCTCPALTSRRYYFEPNHITSDTWLAAGLFTGPIDRRVVFVCESPGPQFKAVNETELAQCWGKTRQDSRFQKARSAYGFDACYITNSVKCGQRGGARHTDAEVAACSRFLIRELQLIQPMVAVGVGYNAYFTLRSAILPALNDPPVFFQITHYSARGNAISKWKHEFPELQRLLSHLKPRSAW